MNTFTETKNATFLAPRQPSAFGLWAGAMPTTLQQLTPNKKAHASTVIGLTLASMLGGVFASHELLPPTFADTAKITTSSLFVERNDFALLGYTINEPQRIAINEYLRDHMTSRDFLREVAIIIDDIYGVKTIRDIHVVDDVDTGKPIMQLTVQSGLPLDDEFDQKDQLLFEKIKASGLAWGLRDVVITQG